MFDIKYPLNQQGSGARFMSLLRKEIERTGDLGQSGVKRTLCNVNTTLISIIVLRILGHKVFIRIDGINSFPITYNFLTRKTKLPAALIFTVLKLNNRSRMFNYVLHLFFNFAHNLRTFVKILLCHHVIYQSKFSLTCYQRFFPNKKYSIINNGTKIYSDLKVLCPLTRKTKILISFHQNRPLKGTRDTLQFLANYRKSRSDFEVTIIGYEANVTEYDRTGKYFSFDDFVAENASWIKVIPKYKNYCRNLSSQIANHDFYLSLARFDPCPNLMLEMLGHGLPVIGCNSGGVPEIIRESGILIPVDDNQYMPYFNHSYDGGVSPPLPADFTECLDNMMSNHNRYRLIVFQHGLNRIDIRNIARQYRTIIK